MRDLFAGKSRCADVQRSPDGIATDILAARLQPLWAHGLVKRQQPPDGGHPRYALTPRGRSLRPVLAALRDWGLAHVDGTDARVQLAAPG